MPVMDGIITLKHLRTNQKTNKIPVIFNSAAERKRTEAFSNGANSFIRCPFNLKELVSLIYFWKAIKNNDFSDENIQNITFLNLNSINKAYIEQSQLEYIIKQLSNQKTRIIKEIDS